MDISEARWLKALEAVYARLKKLLAESMPDNEALRLRCRESTDPNWVQHKQIKPDKPDKPDKPTLNAIIESINGRFRDECLNEHRFTSLA